MLFPLDLTCVGNSKSSRQLILGMSNRSILVIEDIDCTINLHNREEYENEEVLDNGYNKYVFLVKYIIQSFINTEIPLQEFLKLLTNSKLHY